MQQKDNLDITIDHIQNQFNGDIQEQQSNIIQKTFIKKIKDNNKNMMMRNILKNIDRIDDDLSYSYIEIDNIKDEFEQLEDNVANIFAIFKKNHTHVINLTNEVTSFDTKKITGDILNNKIKFNILECEHNILFEQNKIYQSEINLLNLKNKLLTDDIKQCKSENIKMEFMNKTLINKLNDMEKRLQKLENKK